MPSEISMEQMSIYRRTAKRRQAEREQNRSRLRESAMIVACRAADMLKRAYGVEAVYLFGSLAENTVFDEHSDVDIAVRGLDEKVYYRVVSRLLDLNHAIDVDLIRMETAPESLVRKIEMKGRRL